MRAFKHTVQGLSLVLILAAASSADSGLKGGAGSEADGQHGLIFTVDDPMNRNSVTFKSVAPLEDIVGISHSISGQLVFDPEKPELGGHGELSVPVTTLNTGIPLRDQHMASADWLNAEKHPNISFKIVEVREVKSVKSTPGAATYDVVAVGDFTLNGITKRMDVPARITYLEESEATKKRAPGNLLAARADFDLALADFGVKGPAGMDIIGSKVAETVEIELSVVASSAGDSMADKH